MIDTLNVACPICAVAKGQPCEDIAGGYIVNRHVPHIYRMVVAQEELGNLPTSPSPLPDRLRSAADLLDEFGDLYGGAK